MTERLEQLHQTLQATRQEASKVILGQADVIDQALIVILAGQHALIEGVPGIAGMHDIDDYPGATRVPGLVVYRYDAPLCFANSEDFRTRALAAVDSIQ